jgi:hypothetical protein
MLLARAAVIVVATTRVLGVAATTWIGAWWTGRLAIEAVSTWSVIVVIPTLRTVAVGVLITPVEHTLALLEVIGDVVDSLLSRFEAVSAEAALSWKLGLRVHNTRLVVVLGVHLGVNIPKMLREMVLAVAGLNVVDAFGGTEAAHP